MKLCGIELSQLSAQLDNKLSWSHRSCLLVIILIGFLLRWYSLYEGHAFIYFAINDEISALKYAFGFMAGDPHMFYLGQPGMSQGQIPGPLWAIFLSGLYKLGGSSIQGAVFLMVLINTAVIYLVYLLASNMMSARYALFTALFYSLAPWAIYYSAGLYNPMPLAFLGVLLFLALWQTLNNEDSRNIFWVMVLLAAIPQFHMIGVFYIPTILLLLKISSVRLNRRWLVAGISVGMLLYLPYLIGEMTHHWSNLHNVMKGTPGFSPGILKILTIPIGMLTNHPGQWPGYSTPELISFANRWFGSYIVLVVINIISIILALLFVVSFFKKSYSIIRLSKFNLQTALLNYRQQIFMATLLLLPLLTYILIGKAYATRYSILIFPLLFLLPAIYLANIKSERFKNVLLYTLSIMFLCNVYLVIGFYIDQNHKITTAGRFMPAFFQLDAVKNALQASAGKQQAIVLDTSKYIETGNKYREIAAAAIAQYIDLYQDYQQGQPIPKLAQRFILVDNKAKVPTDSKIVYQNNGLFIYSDSPP